MYKHLWLKIWNGLNFLYGLFLWRSMSQLHRLKEKHSGKRCFVIGNGPSLRREDLALLRERGEVTFAANSLIKLFNEIPFAPTYYFAQDNWVILDNKEEIAQWKGFRFIKSHYASRYHIQGTTYYNMWFTRRPIGFSHHLPCVVYSGQTVTYSMIQFAAYMGCNEIYLLGVDCNYSPQNNRISQESYPDKRMFNANRSYAPPEVETNIQAYERALEVCQRRGIAIYNATRGGKLEVFPRIDFDSLFRFDTDAV